MTAALQNLPDARRRGRSTPGPAIRRIPPSATRVETVTAWTGPRTDPEACPAPAAEVIHRRPHRTDVQPGSMLGHYRVVEYLASGGMGDVYRGEDVRCGAAVALKVPRDRTAGRARATQRFLVEASAGARIEHPGVARVLDCGWFDGGAYLAMEYLPGENLREHLKRERRLPLARVLDIGAELAGALDVIHRAGVVHCDLKPANIQLVPTPGARGDTVVKILDFGVARLRGEGSPDPSTDLAGTPHYMAPEQIEPYAALDHRCDIYSLGCILFRLATGVLPFQGSTLEILIGHRIAPPPRPRSINPELPPALDGLILDMMAKQPDRRPSTMLDIVAALEEARPAAITVCPPAPDESEKAQGTNPGEPTLAD